MNEGTRGDLKPDRACICKEKPGGYPLSATRLEGLQCLRTDLDKLASRQMCHRHFEQKWSDSHAGQWLEWQQETPVDAISSIDLSCLLAYFGLGYEANIARLLQRCHYLRHASEAPVTPESVESLRRLPAYLSLIYSKRKDMRLLAVLLDLRMPQPELRQAQWEAIAHLWDRHAAALLRAARHSLPARRTLARSLAHVCCTVNEPILWRTYYRQLQQAIYRRDAQLIWTALRLITLLRHAQRRHENK